MELYLTNSTCHSYYDTSTKSNNKSPKILISLSKRNLILTLVLSIYIIKRDIKVDRWIASIFFQGSDLYDMNVHFELFIYLMKMLINPFNILIIFKHVLNHLILISHRHFISIISPEQYLKIIICHFI